MEKLEPCACCWECKMVQTPWKTTEGPQIKLENTTVWSSGYIFRRTEQSLRHICTQEYSSIIYNSQATEVAQGFTDSWMENVQYILNKETLSVKEKPDTSNNVSGLWGCDLEIVSDWTGTGATGVTTQSEQGHRQVGDRPPTFCLLSSPWTCPGVAPFKDPSSSSWGGRQGYVSHFDLLVLQRELW